MKRARASLASRAAVAALVLALAACENGISTPKVVSGHWLAVEHAGIDLLGARTEHRLELQPDGDYVWTTATFGLSGRASDGLREWYRRAGEWGVDEGELALRTVTGTRWVVDEGVSILDFGGEWNREYEVSREADRLILERLIPPNARVLPSPPLTFMRVANFDNAPQPPASLEID
jgi:hypothetical protein